MELLQLLTESTARAAEQGVNPEIESLESRQGFVQRTGDEFGRPSADQLVAIAPSVPSRFSAYVGASRSRIGARRPSRPVHGLHDGWRRRRRDGLGSRRNRWPNRIASAGSGCRSESDSGADTVGLQFADPGRPLGHGSSSFSTSRGTTRGPVVSEPVLVDETDPTPTTCDGGCPRHAAMKPLLATIAWLAAAVGSLSVAMIPFDDGSRSAASGGATRQSRHWSPCTCSGALLSAPSSTR